MVSLFLLVPISLVLLGAAIWAFVWAVSSGQYDDLDTPAIDILRNDAVEGAQEVVKESSIGDDDAD